MNSTFTPIDYDEAADWPLPLGPVSRLLEGLGLVLASAILGMVRA